MFLYMANGQNFCKAHTYIGNPVWIYTGILRKALGWSASPDGVFSDEYTHTKEGYSLSILTTMIFLFFRSLF